MAESKKFYSAKEAALAVLAKTEELLKSSKHKHIGWDKLHSKLEGEGYSKESADKIDGSIKAKLDKAEGEGQPDHSNPPKKNSEMKPASSHPDSVNATPPPGNNPHEQAEGNNADWGTSPQVKGYIKLAHFIGRHSAKKSAKQPNSNIGTAMGQPEAKNEAAVDPNMMKSAKMKKGIALS